MSPSRHLGYEPNILGKIEPIAWHGVRESPLPPPTKKKLFQRFFVLFYDHQQQITSYNVGKKMMESNAQYLNVLDHEPPRGLLGPSKSIRAMPGAR